MAAVVKFTHPDVRIATNRAGEVKGVQFDCADPIKLYMLWAMKHVLHVEQAVFSAEPIVIGIPTEVMVGYMIRHFYVSVLVDILYQLVI